MTPRLFLRPIELGDAVPISILMTPSVAACLENWPPRLTVAEAMARIAESRLQTARKIGMDWGIFLKPDLAFIGWVGLRRSETAISTLRATYWLGDAYQNQGYGTEAFSTVVKRTRAACPLFEIEATALRENVASINLLKKTGFDETTKATPGSPSTVGEEKLRHFVLRSEARGWPASAVAPRAALSAVL